MDDLQAAGIPVFSLGLSYIQPWRAVAFGRLVNHMMRMNAAGADRFVPDVVHAHLFHAGLVAGGLGAVERSWPLVYSVHICERRKSRFWQFWFERHIFSRCAAVTAVSNAVREFYAGRIRVPGSAVDVIYNGIHPPPVPDVETVLRLRAEWGVASCQRVLGCVGRLDWQKGFDLLLEALPAIARNLPRGETWGLVILGEGPHRARLEALVARAPAVFKIVLPGFRADAPSCIGAFDLFLMPSRYEGYGLTLAEAMSHGVPILASTADSLPELLTGYPNGVTAGIASGQFAEWADAIPGLAARATRQPRELFPVAAMADAYLGVYQRVQAGGK